MTNTANGSTRNDAGKSQAPKVRAFQLDSGATGNLSESVNLFRGNINFPLDFVNLPGAPHLGIKVTASYASNVARQVDGDNLIAPTGVLGLGWSLPYDSIQMEVTSQASMLGNTFNLQSGGNPSKLIALEKDGDTMRFASREFPLWQITYQIGRETWIIRRDDGSTAVFGGPDDERNLLWKSVRWGNWVGGSVNDKAPGGTPHTFVSGWNLQRITTQWGESLSYDYDRDEEPIGAGDLEYTRAAYPKTVTDSLGRSVRYSYLQKEAAEYVNPNAVPEGAPGVAYQNRYETCYLDKVEVFNAPIMNPDGTQGAQKLNYAIDFGWRCVAKNGFLKRYLIRAQQTYASGCPVPPMVFDYNFDGDDDSFGCLTRLTYPSGGSVHWCYDTLPLGNEGVFGLNFQAERPQSSEFTHAVPRIWFGDDYVVVLWHAVISPALRLCVYQYGGRWSEPWETDLAFVGVDLDHLRATLAPDFFALYLGDRGDGEAFVHSFHKDPFAFGTWHEHKLPFEPHVVEAIPEETQLVSGDHFIAIHLGGSKSLFTFDYSPVDWAWSDAKQLAFNGNGVHIPIAAAGNMLLAGFYDDSDQTIIDAAYALLPWGGWRNLEMLQARSQSFQWDAAYSQLYWSVGDGFAVGTYLPENEKLTALRVLRWDVLLEEARVQHLDGGNQLTQAGPSLVASGGFYYRYDGQTWVQTRSGTGEETLHALAQDTVLETHTEGHILDSRLFSYNAFTADESEAWSHHSFPQAQPEPGIGAPQISANYLTWNTSLYHRDPNAEWIEVANAMSGADAASVVNRGPEYILYQNPTQLPEDTRTTLLLLHNGAVVGTRDLGNVRIQNERYAAGLNLTGRTAFATYPAESSFDKTSVFQLYRIQNQNADAVQEVTVVTSVTIDSMDHQDTSRRRTEYTYDLERAVFDSTGTIVQFPHVTARATSADGDQVYNTKENFFFNGLGVEDPEHPRDHYSLLNGMKFCEVLKDADDKEFSSSRHTYTPVTLQTAREGGFTPLARVVQIQPEKTTATLLDQPTLSFGGGISETHLDLPISQIVTYDNATGYARRWQTWNYDANGRPQILVTDFTYAYEKYQAMREANFLNPIVRTQSSVDDIPRQCSVTTFQAWNAEGIWDEKDTWMWDGEGRPDFDFDDPGGPNWIRANEVAGRNAQGYPVLTREQGAPDASMLYDTSGRRLLARFDNGDLSRREVSYTGFESYELDQGWQTPDGGDPARTSRDCHTGTQAVFLDGQACIQNQFKVRAGIERVIFSCWARCPKGYVRDKLNITLQAGFASQSRNLSLSETWTYQTCVLDLDDPSVDRDLTCSIANLGSEALFLDNFFYGPMAGNFSATVLAPDTWRSRAALGNNGETLRLFYNGSGGLQAMVGPDEQSGQLNAVGFSRSIDGDYDKDRPNWQALIKARDGGPFDDFRNADWQERWQLVTGSVNDWVVRDHALTLVGDGPQSVRFKQPLDLESLALGFSLDLADPKYDLAVSLGELSLRWDGALSRWELWDGTETVATGPLETHIIQRQDLLWTIHQGSSMLFVNGLQILEARQLRNDNGAATLDLTFYGSQSAMGNLAIAINPAMTFTLFNGNAQKLQVQQLQDHDLAARGILYDQLGRGVVATKWITYDSLLPGFRKHLISGFDWETGLMNGDATNYYQGQYGRSDDGGYPYYRQRIQLDESARLLELGLPGEAFAIRPGNPHTTRLEYGVNGTGGFLDDTLPQGRYPVTLKTNPDGNQTLTLLDQTGNKLGTVKGPNGLPLDEAMATFSHFDARNYEVRINLPNADWPPTRGAAPFAVVNHYDAFGRLLSSMNGTEAATDTGLLTSVFDINGRLRFQLDADGRGILDGEDRMKYTCYDPLGRKVEQGTFPGTWDRAELQAQAEDGGTPPANANWTFRYEYDGDQDSPHARGRLWKTHSRDADGQVATETLRYDVAGNVIAKNLDYLGTYTSGYRYNHLGAVTRIQYPDASGEGSSPFGIGYDYDATGRVHAINRLDGEKETPIARYRWNAAGSLEWKAFGSIEEILLETRYTYNSPEWARSLESPLFSQTLNYEDNAPEYARFSGLITGERIRRPDRSFSRHYGYDPNGRLATANFEPGGRYEVGNPSPISYDPNGNILSLSQATQNQVLEAKFAPQHQTDRLDEAVLSNGESWRFDYTPGGKTQNAPVASDFDYDPFTGRLRHMRANDAERTTIAYRYGTGQQWLRKTKRVGDAQVLDRRYIAGANGRLLAEREATPFDCQTRYTVWGVGGPVAMIDEQGTNFLVYDHLGSLRQVVNGRSGESSCSFDYQPYGMLMGSADPNADRFRYRFANMEFDRTTQLYLDGLRLYSPASRRFLTPDPAGQYPSPYVYVSGNPLSLVDPNGAFSLGGFLVSGAELMVGLAIPGFEVLTVAGAFGMGYTLRAGDDFNWKSYAGMEIAGTVSTAELVAGITVDILSAGALAEGVGGALSGAGIAGLTDVTVQMIGMQNGEFSLKEWAIQDALGATTGAITAGIGAVATYGADLAVQGITSSIEGTTGKLLAAGAEGLIKTAGSATSGFVNNVITQEVTTGQVDFGAALNATFSLSTAFDLAYNTGSGMYNAFEVEANKALNPVIDKLTFGKVDKALGEVKSPSKPMVWGFKGKTPSSSTDILKPVGNRLYELGKGEAGTLWNAHKKKGEP
ncbi:RHS repeat-associated core domain-containing protein [Sulfidibacter corallicola]|uniref:RHS repeat-associated core domain-containing protein n=1 Tax=Sulfidibacter corallicola TaxID=2818388 RepID=A0A8A4THN5_SULCO|nr:RHS repeat-associated core domain-containing protein [Sulfidibacter corallicola]QTD48682.1 RHS repeat-associated core domain-containing protein [Sulfidibacter corallicola]